MLGTLNYRPSVIVITEVNSKIIHNNLCESDFSLNGYKLYSVNISVSSQRSIIVYVDSSLISSQLEIAEEFSECMFVKIKMVNNIAVTIGAFYRSPGSSLDNDQKLVKCINSFKTFNHNKLLLLGDFNFPNINWCNNALGHNLNVNSSAYKFVSCLKNNYLTQHVLFPTRARGSQTSHTLDLIISNEDIVEDVFNLSPLGKSDHSVLHCVCKLYTETIVNISKLNFNKGDYKGLCVYSSDTFDIDYFENCTNVNDSWTYLKSAIESGQTLFIPHVDSSAWMRKQSWKFPINSSLRKLIKKKHRCWTRFQKNKDNKILSEYKRIRNLVRKESRQITQKNQKNIALTCKNNPKKFWQHVRSKTVSSPGIGDIKVPEGNAFKTLSTDVEKAEVFSDYFSQIYTVESDVAFVELPEIMPLNSLPQIVFSEPVVLRKLDELKVNKSPGPDLLHPRVLYEIRHELVGPLTCLFNKSMNLGVVPDEWKTSVVSVLHKKGKKDCVENYRPISLTCICCKLMESVVRDLVMNYFLINNLFSNNQYGFIKRRSTVLQLLKVADDWVKSPDDGDQVDIIYTDFEKAFDKVPHRRLISKLRTYGLNEQLINWIRAFLFSRSQQVKINRIVSGFKPVLSGIPQGSVLCPLLFVIFINDLPLVCEDLSKIFLFADDAKLYKSIRDICDVDCLNRACKELFTWSENWLMKLNIPKCKVLSLCRNTSSIVKYDYGFDVPGQDFLSLKHESHIKDLGVMMSSDLSFDDHIYDKINMANKMLGIVRRNFADLDTNSFLLIYKSMIRSHLEYASSVWNPYKKGLINDIENIQKRATKLIRVCKDLSYRDRLTFLKLPTLKYRRLRGDMIELFKILSGFYDTKVVPSLERNVDSRTRGNAFKLKVVRCKYDVRKFSFCNRVVNIWNSLPDYVVLSNSVNVFKNNLDKHWKNELLYYDFEASLTGCM